MTACDAPLPRDHPKSGHRGPQGRECALVVDHPGPHSMSGHSLCNRPKGHDGAHMILTETAVRLAEWPA